MIINKVINELFSAPSSISVLRELAKRNVGVSGREIARFANVTPQSAHNALSKLEALKIVKREFVGKSHYFILNRKHFLYNQIIKPIFETEIEFTKTLFNKIKKELSKTTESILLFGSTARNEETAQSDLDICIVYNSDKKRIEEIVSRLRDYLYDEYGVTFAPFYITSREFKKRAKHNMSPINSIVLEGKLISGKSIKGTING
ncbi:hypothetical protein APF79_00095 [bacterium BRH_c32]|nr:MAG: hypothetical protein APF79_00095 [bacterium BRH_c32]